MKYKNTTNGTILINAKDDGGKVRSVPIKAGKTSDDLDAIETPVLKARLDAGHLVSGAKAAQKEAKEEDNNKLSAVEKENAVEKAQKENAVEKAQKENAVEKAQKKS